MLQRQDRPSTRSRPKPARMPASQPPGTVVRRPFPHIRPPGACFLQEGNSGRCRTGNAHPPTWTRRPPFRMQPPEAEGPPRGARPDRPVQRRGWRWTLQQAWRSLRARGSPAKYETAKYELSDFKPRIGKASPRPVPAPQARQTARVSADALPEVRCPQRARRRPTAQQFGYSLDPTAAGRNFKLLPGVSCIGNP